MAGVDANTILLLHNDTTSYVDEIGHTTSSTSFPPLESSGDFINCANLNEGGTTLDFIGVNRSTDIEPGSGAWTIDFRIKRTGTLYGNRKVYSFCPDTGALGYAGSMVDIDSSGNLRYYFSPTLTGWQINGLTMFYLEPDVWTHVVIQRSAAGVYTFWKNGTQMASDTRNIALPTPTNTTYGLIIGNRSSLNNGYVGQIDEFRYSNVERYSATFTPPTEPYSSGTPRSFNSTSNISTSIESDGNATRELDSTSNISTSIESNIILIRTFNSDSNIEVLTTSTAYNILLTNNTQIQSNIPNVDGHTNRELNSGVVVNSLTVTIAKVLRRLLSQSNITTDSESYAKLVKLLNSAVHISTSTESTIGLHTFSSSAYICSNTTTVLRQIQNINSQPDIQSETIFIGQIQIGRNFNTQVDITLDTSLTLEKATLFNSSISIVSSTTSAMAKENRLESNVSILNNTDNMLLQAERRLLSQCDITSFTESRVSTNRILLNCTPSIVSNVINNENYVVRNLSSIGAIVSNNAMVMNVERNLNTQTSIIADLDIIVYVERKFNSSINIVSFAICNPNTERVLLNSNPNIVSNTNDPTQNYTERRLRSKPIITTSTSHAEKMIVIRKLTTQTDIKSFVEKYHLPKEILLNSRVNIIIRTNDIETGNLKLTDLLESVFSESTDEYNFV